MSEGKGKETWRNAEKKKGLLWIPSLRPVSIIGAIASDRVSCKKGQSRY